MAVADTVAWEMSEPGTGPTPNYQNPELDKAIKEGWRYPSPPAAFAQISTTVQLPFETR